jgi:hypothetical protein
MSEVENVLPVQERIARHSDAFISYSRRDKPFAARLERALEKYRPPRDLPVPQRYLEVYRDEEDFSGGEYATVLLEHLSTSAKLIVICSPNARVSRYVDEEIRKFVELRGSSADIIPVLIAGLPNNEAVAGQEAEAAFPQALCDGLVL